ncbi:TPA: hypothetical protein N0F65_002949 [Lagenidium giganteum]|uniref:Uncharacterized protein n=1 Tax=Lagenidium giganteum TaxID=4803 RepID=A0AAV2Z9A0_9STRA|nr:TPA: hypothetical protein N0F65_002949 [Lagenidium giganteum]
MRCAALVRAWEATQVELHGRYSTRRLQQFHEYCQRASVPRVLAVLLLTPLPCLVVVLLTDAIPMESPSKGLTGSFPFWIRAWITAAVMTGGQLEQFRTSLSKLPIRNRHVITLTLIDATVTIGGSYAIACAIGFPIPFTFVVVMVPCALEFASLVIVQVTFMRYVRLSPLHLLAFVLEKQVKMAQSHLILWFLFMIDMMLYHFGERYPCRDDSWLL